MEAADLSAPLVEAMVARWREAPMRAWSRQQALHDLLAPAGLAQLAPVFDSVMRLADACFARVACAGCPAAIDEKMVWRLLNDPEELRRPAACGRAREACPLDDALRIALHSTRIMAGWNH